MITVIDYGLSNLASIENALEKLTIPYKVSSDPGIIKKADGLILPGVGAAMQGMKNLRQKGLDKTIREEVEKGKPILGICLGMQLLLSNSEEGNVTCLNIIKGRVKKFNTTLKIPQIGWNNVSIRNRESLFLKDINDESYFYFVNSYACFPNDKNIITGITNYGGNFCSFFVKDKIVGAQFHPEKSGDAGLQLLKNFWEAIE